MLKFFKGTCWPILRWGVLKFENFYQFVIIYYFGTNF